VITAVNTVPDPSQMVFPLLDEIEIVGVDVLLTVIVMLLLKTVAGLGQLKLLLISQVTISPLFNAEVT
jgi:hypothetical protein